MRLLVAEDDAAHRSVLHRGLTKQGFIVDTIGRGDDALLLLETTSYSAALIDWRMPGMDGTEVIRQARHLGLTTPLILLTAKDTLSDRVEGLDSGADDYVVKPYDLAEVLARLRAIWRRPPLATESILRVANLILNPATHEVVANGRTVHVTRSEYTILELLMRNSPAVVSRTGVAEGTWSAGAEISMNALEAHIARLRAKVSGSGIRIVAIRGVGYQLRAV